MSPIVADDSHVSAWSLSAEAVFFRNLVRGSPFLIDWLLTSCKEDKEVFRKLVTSFMVRATPSVTIRNPHTGILNI
jgi:hypothetical protein